MIKQELLCELTRKEKIKYILGKLQNINKEVIYGAIRQILPDMKKSIKNQKFDA